MRGIPFRLVGAALGVALATSACGGSSAAAGVVRLGYFPNITHAAALIADGNGSLEAVMGSALQTTTFSAGPELLTALLSGAVDIAFIGPNPAIIGHVRSDGAALRVIGGAASGGAALVVSPAINDASDLRGKTLATPQIGNTQDVALRWWLKQNGLNGADAGKADVRIVHQENAQTLDTFRLGQIAGAWLPEPWVSRLVAEGGAKVLVDERTLWPEGRFPSTVIVARTEFLRARPALVRAFLDIVVEQIRLIRSNPAGAQTIVNDRIGAITSKKLKPEILSTAWKRLDVTYDPLVPSFRSIAEHAAAVGLLDTSDVSGIFDLALLNSVLTAERLPPVTV
jgi:NitT/TauT family transport system substrate-binding protein